MKKLLIALSFAMGCGVALAAGEKMTVMTFEEIDVDKNGVITMEEAKVYAPLHKHMQDKKMTQIKSIEYKEWTGTTNK